jgi:hypothetical protein
MSIHLSPGVYSQEKDLSDIVTRIATASSALVGYSVKGSVDEIKLITSDQQFIDEYGEPDPDSGHFFHYAALAFLGKGSTLYCLRVVNGALYGGVDIQYSTSGDSNVAFATGKSSRTFAPASGQITETVLQIVGVNPGVWNNKIGIEISDIKDGSDPIVTDQYTFKISVFSQDADGNWVQVETWKVSRKRKYDGYGKQLYMVDKINGVSKYIYVLDSAMFDTVMPKVQVNQLDFAAGSDGSSISATHLVTGWEEFINPDRIDVRILINGGETAISVQTEMMTIAEARRDCVAILDIPWSSLSSVGGMTAFRNTIFDSSYCALYAGWGQIYDKYNDIVIDVPASGHIAAQYAYNDYAGKAWTAPAGDNRGVLDLLSITGPTGKLVFTEGERDTLYVDQINPLQIFSGSSPRIWGQKTLQKKGSATDRINVRRLLIVIEKSMAISLRQFVFEPNDEITRFRIEALLNSYLGDLSAQGAFQTEGEDQGFHVVCDGTNNTAVVIDDNELRVDVFVKPSRAAEYIRLQTIVTATGASFEELIARGVAF